ncbi:MAG TPA: hypothetical protein QGF58_29650 [Myxococcota bacterium]|nr:hypothetical protein [Myxococcota bacterium]
MVLAAFSLGLVACDLLGGACAVTCGNTGVATQDGDNAVCGG